MLPRKALPLALDALAHARVPATLTIVGSGLYPNEVRRLIAQRGLTDRVAWQGRRLSWEEVRNEYLTHDALLFTSVRESFGSQIVEAMALGLPVIFLDMHGAHDFVPEGASLRAKCGTARETVEELARQIEKMSRLSQKERNAMSSSALDFARTLTWKERAAFLEEIYGEISPSSAKSVRLLVET
jgi:glycosyltransferase involved in cell wall biosynthesis